MVVTHPVKLQTSYKAQGQSIQLTRKITRSGEGEVWHTNRLGQIAKIYHDFDERRSRKLAIMVADPPKDPNQHLGHVSYAWPSAVLTDERDRTVGFLMPLVKQSVDIMELYHPQRRNKVARDLTWTHLHVVAGSIASLVWAIHEAGYVLGDIKPQNILVNAKTHPSIIDTDSFQVCDPNTGELYHCQVGSESFTPPELIGKNLSEITQTTAHDGFRLGLILYLLLFGEHPFKGKWVGSGESPSPNDLVQQGYWPYGNQSLIQPSFLTIPISVVHPALQVCFLRCFNQGHSDPLQRPTPQDWVKALQVAIADLKPCRANPHHVYSRRYGHCHWCDRAQNLGVDVFPAPDSPQKVFKQELDHLLREIPLPTHPIRKPAETEKVSSVARAGLKRADGSGSGLDLRDWCRALLRRLPLKSVWQRVTTAWEPLRIGHGQSRAIDLSDR
jgi:DNA-binding helix-hairpin-helix protein with protein kinase domain